MTRLRVWWGAVLLAVVTGLPGRAAGDAGDLADLFPVRRFQPLPGKTLGVLVGGEAVLALEGRRGPADAFWLSTGGGSYRGVYVPVAKKYLIGGLNVPVGQQGERTRRFDKLSPATPKTVADWGIAGPYALVEVEVNGGLGGPAAETFVATQMTLLDGTPEYPLHTARVVEELRGQFRAHLQEQKTAIALALGDAREKLPRGYRLSAAREQEELLYLTWLPESRQLRAVFRQRMGEKAFRPEDRAAPRPPAEPGEPPPPPRRAGVLLGAEIGMAYDVSRKGTVERRRPLAPRVFAEEFTEAVPR